MADVAAQCLPFQSLKINLCLARALISWPLSLLTTLFQYASFSFCLLSAVAECVYFLGLRGNLPWLLAYFQVMSLTKDDNILAGWGWCGQVAKHAGMGISEQGPRQGLALLFARFITGGVQHVVVPTAYCLDGSNRPSRPSRVPASSVCHIYMRLEIRRMTGEVIKTGTTSLLSLILNMNHPSILDVWVCRHIWFSGEEAFACCLTLWLPFFWQEPLKCRPRGMDNGLSHSGTASHTLCAIPSDSHSRCSLHYTSPLFNPREVLASGQPSLSVWVTEYVRTCLCVCVCVCVGT